ncbi:hypothetical protein PISL3812_06898 [Talaromyces islandicus]|uniref:Uncharacterized protein n=1 Tax=Talaromyces islandicus TaxID=28573 RepID=A0A0U1M2R8_TALIS|nr:hypothetical protein PISL3812_06898 [Talaromyces islandicus]
MSLRRLHTTNTPSLAPKNSNLLVPLIDSPLPSPVLPSIIPSHGKRPPGSGKRKAIRVCFWSLVIFILVRITFLFDFKAIPNTVQQWLSDRQTYLPSDVLPNTPAPIKLTNGHGREKWTISIPTQVGFPLSPPQITDLCTHCDEMSTQLSSGKFQPFDYSRPDRNFVDIAEARLDEFSSAKQPSNGDGNQSPICETSLTFVMQSEDAGLGKTLMQLWLSYGLAKKQGRSFFIDDTNWAYGDYSSFFKPPPKPACRPPPPSHRLPCPLQARHLVVSSANSKWIFGNSFKEYFGSSRASAPRQQKAIFEMARSGYEALFNLVGDDAKFLDHRIRELDRQVRGQGGLVIGLHVRRGDLHPLESQYRDSYIPLDKYANRAETLFETYLAQAASDEILQRAMKSYSRIVLASDDPDVYTASELRGAEKAQSYISLASKSALVAAQEANPRRGENAGWEGGFYKDLFWSLGVSSDSYFPKDSPLPTNQVPESPRSGGGDDTLPLDQLRFQPSKESLGLRELIGRAYLLDLAVLGQSDRVICGIGSASCRLLAVMMGWERAITREAWQNVDGSWNWAYTASG